MEHHPILDWLFSAAGAGWVFGLISCAALLAEWLGSRRGAKLICKEDLKSYVMSSGGRIGVTFDGSPVKALALAKFGVYNSARKVIGPIALRLVFPQTSKILDARSEITPKTSEPQASVEFSKNEVRVGLPYLNPFRAHKHRVSIAVILDGEFENVEVIGGGPGWSVAREGIPGSAELKRRWAIMITAFAACLALMFLVYAPFIRTHYGISDKEVSPRAFAAFLPAILVLSGLVWVLSRWILKPQIMREVSRILK